MVSKEEKILNDYIHQYSYHNENRLKANDMLAEGFILYQCTRLVWEWYLRKFSVNPNDRLNISREQLKIFKKDLKVFVSNWIRVNLT